MLDLLPPLAPFQPSGSYCPALYSYINGYSLARSPTNCVRAIVQSGTSYASQKEHDKALPYGHNSRAYTHRPVLVAPGIGGVGSVITLQIAGNLASSKSGPRRGFRKDYLKAFAWSPRCRSLVATQAMRYAVMVTGPAGAGKSTFCSAMMMHAQASGRSMHLFNLDPAAERFELPDGTAMTPSVDIRDLISLEEVMEDLGLGPNGGLVYCFEYLLQNLDWLHETLGDFEDDYLLIDCPGQIELYTHIPIMPRLISALQQANIRPCACYLLESQFMEDKSKFFAGVLSAMSCMINLEVPHINLLSKMDLVKNGKGGSAKLKKDVDRYLETDPMLIHEEVKSDTNPKFHALNEAIVQLIEDFNMVQFLPLDVTDEDSMQLVLSHIDNAIQYGEAEEPKEPKDMDQGDFEEE